MNKEFQKAKENRRQIELEFELWGVLKNFSGMKIADIIYVLADMLKKLTVKL